MESYILAIDQGTSSTRAVVFTRAGKMVGQHQLEIKQYFPQDGWVEHDPEEIWQSVLICCQTAMANAKLVARDIAAIGISNQRETTLIWDRVTGETLYPAIVWQDRRTADACQQLQAQKNVAEHITQKTGLLLDPYFSATKIAWILDHIPEARARAERGELAFGTVDAFLLWRLTGGKQHATDASNASRTMLFNIHTQSWDEELLRLMRIPTQLLPTVLDNNAHFGDVITELWGHAIPITGMAGDQQAATIGQACFMPGMIKATYGTGCFVLLNTGPKPMISQHRLITTVAYRVNNQPIYGLEGSIFVAGAAVQWLRDALHVIAKASETQNLAASIEDTKGVYLVPAFTGLGAPYWDPQARGALLGLTRDTGIAHIVRAALEAVCYQTRDLLLALQSDYPNEFTALRVDGGMVANNWLLQFLADIVDIRIERPTIIETSALGAAYLAGLGAGLYSSLEEISQLWSLDQTFTAQMLAEQRMLLYNGWLEAVRRVCDSPLNYVDK